MSEVEHPGKMDAQEVIAAFCDVSLDVWMSKDPEGFANMKKTDPDLFMLLEGAFRCAFGYGGLVSAGLAEQKSREEIINVLRGME